MRKKRNCKVCGVKFVTKSGNQVYCSEECREKERKKRYTEMYQKRKAQKKVMKLEQNKKKKKTFKGELAIFNQRAKEMGLSYGQYMIFLQTERDKAKRAKMR